MKDIKVVIGANYGDEGKGLLTRHFVTDAFNENKNPIVIFHNGTAQRGHTVDYHPGVRHIYHHFGSGTGDGAPTFFTNTFFIHPMEFERETLELERAGINVPTSFYDPNCIVITPFDMLIDHATEAYIEWDHGEREFGSCGLGTWCATDRFPSNLFTMKEWRDARASKDILDYRIMMSLSFAACVEVLKKRKVDLDKIPQYRKFFDKRNPYYERIITNFALNLNFFFSKAKEKTFDEVYQKYDSLIFENGQGLGLDMNVDNDWHTTSNTGLVNPEALLKEKEDYNAEVCYVSRSYLTRHGEGPLEEEVKKLEICSKMWDNTNIKNEFQGSLRYGFLKEKEQKERINKDWRLVKNNPRFKKTMAVTHCNEFEIDLTNYNYISYNPFTVLKR